MIAPETELNTCKLCPSNHFKHVYTRLFKKNRLLFFSNISKILFDMPKKLLEKVTALNTKIKRCRIENFNFLFG